VDRIKHFNKYLGQELDGPLDEPEALAVMTMDCVCVGVVDAVMPHQPIVGLGIQDATWRQDLGSYVLREKPLIKGIRGPYSLAEFQAQQAQRSVAAQEGWATVTFQYKDKSQRKLVATVADRLAYLTCAPSDVGASIRIQQQIENLLWVVQHDQGLADDLRDLVTDLLPQVVHHDD